MNLLNLNAAHPKSENQKPQGTKHSLLKAKHTRAHMKIRCCCFRQDLTGFTSSYCTGPISQRPLLLPCPTVSHLKTGIKPSYSGLEVTKHRWLSVWHGKS